MNTYYKNLAQQIQIISNHTLKIFQPMNRNGTYYIITVRNVLKWHAFLTELTLCVYVYMYVCTVHIYIHTCLHYGSFACYLRIGFVFREKLGSGKLAPTGCQVVFVLNSQTPDSISLSFFMFHKVNRFAIAAVLS